MSIQQDITNHTAYIRKLRTAGGTATQEQAKTTTEAPVVDAGLFDYPEWEPDRVYERNELFRYQGVPGFARQAIRSQAHYPPFSLGTEALYGARPRMHPDGTYPYVYNMLIEPGMLIWSVKDGQLYKCILPSPYTLIYDPADAVGVCELVTEEA